MSLVLFNMVIDELLDSLPPELGVAVGQNAEGGTLYCPDLGFADDLIVCSNSRYGCNERLRKLCRFFDARSMKINAKKCFPQTYATFHQIVFIYWEDGSYGPSTNLCNVSPNCVHLLGVWELRANHKRRHAWRRGRGCQHCIVSKQKVVPFLFLFFLGETISILRGVLYGWPP